MKDEGEINDFLGIKVERDTNAGTITLTQPGLIESVCKDLGLDGERVHSKKTPATQILHADPDGAPRQETWNYRSVIGKLNFIAANTRPDISMAVHQAARYSANPKAIHEVAVKHIGRYLHHTRTKGLILRPKPDKTLNAYVDADFAGRWHQNYAHLRDSVLSRTGYVLTFCGCPVLWASKLQSEVALSTTEAEYIALSTCMRELLPMRTLLQDITTYSFISDMECGQSTTFAKTLETSNIYEDNASCIVVATTDQMRPRTKHIGVKWHFFKDHISNGDARVVKVDSKENWADIFTKPLTQAKFEYICHLMMGW